VRRFLVAAGLIASACLPAAAAGSQDVALPSTGTPLSSAPPLLSGIAQITPVFRGSLSSRERVTARIDPEGKVRGVNVLQRIVVPTGDFFFAVAAPAVDVTAAKGSGSQPGLRPNAILWQGFSPGHRVLASDARLRLHQSVPYLPLGVPHGNTARTSSSALPTAQERTRRPSQRRRERKTSRRSSTGSVG
jgi:hypothetical protein